MVKIGTARRGLLASALLASLALAGCTTPTTYHPAADVSANSPGYSDKQLSTNTYEVNFTGNTVTSRDTVDRYLFYRAAQLTIQKGFRTFTMMKGDTALDDTIYANVEPAGPGFGWNGWGGYWAPSWRYHGPFGWRTWAPWQDGPFWGDQVDINSVDNYQATAVIKMSNTPVTASTPHSYDAQTVIERLTPTIKLPK
ncbi:CC0125/CC1285 family lipoprotein [Sphingomonas abaci]|uniref:DUF4136 domain-containing protein n=1 Tax=Sphingomonas abaci TaxID=237611 RepID=A0A7W7AJE4_9SPHN|nr:hypothetical protein [Sphingomonas abaci]MBB4617127.1 hypothetical protein [Sphingomonas abaci]